MVRIKYIDHDGSAPDVEAFGVSFTDGETSEVDSDIAPRFKGNRYFEVSTTATSDDLKAVHRGRGVYAIVKGENVLKEGLSKEDADAFNALSDEEKVAALPEPKAPAPSADVGDGKSAEEQTAETSEQSGEKPADPAAQPSA